MIRYLNMVKKLFGKQDVTVDSLLEVMKHMANKVETIPLTELLEKDE